MKTNEIMAVVVLLAVIGWIGFMATNASATYSPANNVNAAANSAAPYNAQGSAQQAAAQTANGGSVQQAAASSAQGGAGQTVTIPIKVVGGYYEPRQITVKQGTKVRLDLDPNTLVGCMVNFNIWGLNLKKYVTAQDHILEFTADTPGVYKTSCNMGMGDGRLIVEAAGANTASANSAQAGAGSAVANSAALAAPTNPSAGPTGGSCGGSSGGCGCGGSR